MLNVVFIYFKLLVSSSKLGKKIKEFTLLPPMTNDHNDLNDFYRGNKNQFQRQRRLLMLVFPIQY